MKKYLIPIVALLTPLSVSAAGVPSTMRYSGTAIVNNAPAANTSVSVSLLRANGSSFCQQTTSTGPDGRFTVNLTSAACIAGIEADSDIEVIVRVSGTDIQTTVKPVPYAVEAKNARTAAGASGALAARLAALEIAKVALTYAVPSNSAIPVTIGLQSQVPATLRIADNTNGAHVNTTGSAFRFTAPRPGLYAISYSVRIDPLNSTSPGTNQASGLVYVGGNGCSGTRLMSSASTNHIEINADESQGYAIFELNQGDVITLCATSTYDASENPVHGSSGPGGRPLGSHITIHEL